MKANELMIGDWLFAIGDDGKKHICRANNIERDYVNNTEDFCVDFFGTDFEPEWPDIMFNVEPIPLAQKILEKNGFRQNKKCPFVYETDDEDVIIDLYDPDPNARLSKKEDYDKMVGVRLSPEPPYGFSYWGQSLMIRANYVHELQHALRLCGIEKEIEL